MADYRELSQQYAQGGIRTTVLLNGGAAIALLSQLGSLLSAGLGGSVTGPMILWALGTFAGAAAWVPAFVSTRFVDKHEREQEPNDHLTTSNKYMTAGLWCVAISLLLFLAGCSLLACSLQGL